jgi:choline-sulfatase
MIEETPMDRLGFAEVHVKSTKNAAFMVRDGDMKLIFHVGAPSQLFDLGNDPQETNDLAQNPAYKETLEELQRELRRIVDPDAANVRAKTDQLAHALKHGGPQAIRSEQNIVASPPPV